MKYTLVLAMLVSGGLSGAAENGRYAPLPDKIATARTVFLENDGAQQKFTDNIFEQLQEWGRWRVVTNRSEAIS